MSELFKAMSPLYFVYNLDSRNLTMEHKPGIGEYLNEKVGFFWPIHRTTYERIETRIMRIMMCLA